MLHLAVLSLSLSSLLGLARSGSLYIGRSEEVNYDTAISRCAAFGGQLATFGSDDEFQTLLAIRNDIGSSTWIGFDDRNQEHFWRFIDGDESYCSPQGSAGTDCDDIDQWAPKEPNDWGSGEDCAQLYPTSINDVPCDRTYPYICEYDASTFKAVHSEGAIYVARNEKVNYATAMSRCDAAGGQLATFSSNTQFQAMLSVRNSIGSNTFIGLNDMDDDEHCENGENFWKFVDGDTSFCSPYGTGTDCDDIDQWTPGEPNNVGEEDCAELTRSFINDQSCHDAIAYICEFNEDSFSIGSRGAPYLSLPAPRGNGPYEPNANYYVLEITGYHGLALLVVMLSLVTVSVYITYLCSERRNATKYSKVAIYADSEQTDVEKL